MIPRVALALEMVFKTYSTLIVQLTRLYLKLKYHISFEREEKDLFKNYKYQNGKFDLQLTDL